MMKFNKNDELSKQQNMLLNAQILDARSMLTKDKGVIHQKNIMIKITSISKLSKILCFQ